ncbi:hypothetical protein Ancab_025343, partial [Ancistrocladus abbreviatus]
QPTDWTSRSQRRSCMDSFMRAGVFFKGRSSSTSQAEAKSFAIRMMYSTWKVSK